jgi:D-serine deaminase-like pyridoxal phosphate-dependent protein
VHARVFLEAAASVETPVGVVDEAVRERNLRRMQDLAGRLGVRLRPHAKTHKSVAVARRQLELGAVGLTVATLTEATVFADAGVEDILIAHMPVGEAKLRRLCALAARIPRLAVAVDSLAVARTLPESIELMWEVDMGLHRLGTAPGRPTVDAVSELLAEIPAERFRGLITHGGLAYRSTSSDEVLAAARQEVGSLTATAAELRARGIEVCELSVGSTPTSTYWAQVAGATEIRPGTYVYGDTNQVRLGSCALADCAFAVVGTVVSVPEATRAVIDAGSKALSLDLRVPGVDGCGTILDRPDLRLDRLSEEHGVVISERSTGLHVGDRLAIVATHVCTAVNLHAKVLVAAESGGTRWEPVDARGWS